MTLYVKLCHIIYEMLHYVLYIICDATILYMHTPIYIYIYIYTRCDATLCYII